MFYIDPTFTTKKINKALKEQREITFKDGIYKLTECLILHSDTKITCESGVAFERHHKWRMLQTFADENTTKYNGVHDVSWNGGFFFADTNEAFANVLGLDERGYADSSEDCLTKTDGVFVAGDCRKKDIRQVTTAVSDGAVAALAAIKYLDNK